MGGRKAIGIKPFTRCRAITGKFLSIPSRRHGLARVYRRGKENENECSLKAHELGPIPMPLEVPVISTDRMSEIPIRQGVQCLRDSASATWVFTARKLSGTTEIESMPQSTRNSANSG